MGLDMFLCKKLYIYTNNRSSEKIKLSKFLGLDEIENESDNSYSVEIDLSKLSEITFDVAYWRKNNHIHKWFVDNVQEGKDDCGDYYVSVEQLEELVDICERILADHSLADDLLPTQEGFFFGSTAYDEHYFDSLSKTIEILKKELEHENSKRFTYHYRSSW